MSLKKSKLNRDSMISIIKRKYAKEHMDISNFRVEEGYAFPPERVYIALNDSCQCHCKMCANSKKTSDDRSFSEDVLDKIVKELSDFGTYFVFYRQEPLMYEDFRKCLEIINQYGAKCQITTNGLLLDKYIDEILDSNVTKLWVSIDGYGETHDTIRGYKGCFDKVIDNVERLLERRGDESKLMVGISTSCHKYNYLNLIELAKFVQHLPIDVMVVNQMRFCTEEMASSDMGYASNSSLKSEEYSILDVDPQKYMEVQKSVKELLGGRVIFNPEFRTEADVERYYEDRLNPYESISCMSSWLSCDVTVDGEIEFCNIMHSFNPGLTVRNNSFMDVWNSQEVRAARLNILENTPRTSCGRCSHMLSMPNLIFDSML